MSYKTFTVDANGKIEAGIVVSSLVTKSKAAIPGLHFLGNKGYSLFLRVFLDNQSYQHWQENGCETKILKARVSEELPPKLVARISNIYSINYAIVLFKDIEKLELGNKQVIAWGKSKNKSTFLLLLKKEEVIKIGAYFYTFTGRKILKLKET